MIVFASIVLVVLVLANLLACFIVPSILDDIQCSFDDGVKVGHLFLLFIVPAFIIDGVFVLLFSYVFIPLFNVTIFRFKKKKKQ